MIEVAAGIKAHSGQEAKVSASKAVVAGCDE